MLFSDTPEIELFIRRQCGNDWFFHDKKMPIGRDSSQGEAQRLPPRLVRRREKFFPRVARRGSWAGGCFSGSVYSGDMSNPALLCSISISRRPSFPATP